jgi:hypothetical protein
VLGRSAPGTCRASGPWPVTADVSRKNMNPLRLALLLPLASIVVQAQEPNYEAELQRAMKLYPPGDYDGIPVRQFSPTTVIEKVKVVPTFDLLEPVEPSDKDNGTLNSEAAEYFASGHWDLSMKRYRQLLLSDPDNKDARANLYDIMLLRSMYGDDAHLKEAATKHREMRERLTKNIKPKK